MSSPVIIIDPDLMEEGVHSIDDVIDEEFMQRDIFINALYYVYVLEDFESKIGNSLSDQVSNYNITHAVNGLAYVLTKFDTLRADAIEIFLEVGREKRLREDYRYTDQDKAKIFLDSVLIEIARQQYFLCRNTRGAISEGAKTELEYFLGKMDAKTRLLYFNEIAVEIVEREPQESN
jgi:hypothetical protein